MTEKTLDPCGSDSSDQFGDATLTKATVVAEEAADLMAMLASQIREAARGQGSYPSPWRLDDCVTGYRQAYQELMLPNTGGEQQ